MGTPGGRCCRACGILAVILPSITFEARCAPGFGGPRAVSGSGTLKPAKTPPRLPLPRRPYHKTAWWCETTWWRSRPVRCTVSDIAFGEQAMGFRQVLGGPKDGGEGRQRGLS